MRKCNRSVVSNTSAYGTDFYRDRLVTTDSSTADHIIFAQQLPMIAKFDRPGHDLFPLRLQVVYWRVAILKATIMIGDAGKL